MKKQLISLTQLLFLLPVMVAFTIVILVPFIIGIYYSFTDWSRALQELNWVGFDNYVGMFNNAQFKYSIVWTTIYTISNVVVVNVVAIMFAIFVTQQLKLKNVYRAGFFLPNLIGGIVLGTIWGFIFHYALVGLGNNLSIPFLQTDMLSNPQTAKFAMIAVGSWQYIGYIMMIYIAALQNVPRDLLEAANIDGATILQRIRYITIPMITPAITIGVFLTLVNAFKQYDINVSLTNGGPTQQIAGQSVNSTQLIAMNIIKTSQSQTIENFKAVGQAQAVVFFLILLVVAILQVVLTKRKEVEM